MFRLRVKQRDKKSKILGKSLKGIQLKMEIPKTRSHKFVK